MKTYLMILLTFLFSSVSAFALTGYWERMHPELNGEVPGPRFNAYMCPIGERKVLMLNGDGPGNPYYYNDTWLYHYDEDRWQRIQCYSQPDTYNNDPSWQPMLSVSKDIAITIGKDVSYWFFYFPDLKWHRIYNGIAYPMGYTIPYADGKYVGGNGEITYLYEIDPQTLLLKTTEISTPDNNLRVAAGYQISVDLTYAYSQQGGYLNNNNPVFYTPNQDTSFRTGKPLPFIYFDTSDFKWKNVERDFKIKSGMTPIPNLSENILLSYHKNTMDTTYFYYYDSASNMMKEKSIIFLNNRPEIEHPNYQNKMVKIKDSVVLFFGGYKDEYGKKDSETWIFRLTDTTTVIDTAGEDTGHIFYVGNNSYFLKEIESAELYDLQGILMGKYYDNGVVDLSKYANSAYFLRYTTDGKKYRTEKIIKK